MVGDDNPFEAPDEQPTEIASRPITEPPPAPKIPKNADGLPDLMALLTTTIEDFTSDPVSFIAAGSGWYLPVFGLVMVSMVASFALLLGGPLLGAAIDAPDLGVLIGVGGFFVLYIGLIFASMVVVAPMTASLGRSALALIERGEKMSFGSAYKSVKTDLVPVITLNTVIMVGTLVGVLFCYVPALVVSVLVGMALPAMYVHRLGTADSLRLSVKHVMAHPGWHLGYWGLYFAIHLVGSAIPLVGAAIALPVSQVFLLRGYVEVFGGSDSEVPDLDAIA